MFRYRQCLRFEGSDRSLPPIARLARSGGTDKSRAHAFRHASLLLNHPVAPTVHTNKLRNSNTQWPYRRRYDTATSPLIQMLNTKYSKQQINWHQTSNSRHSWQLLKFRPIPLWVRCACIGWIARVTRVARAIFRSPAVFKPQALAIYQFVWLPCNLHLRCRWRLSG